MSDGSTGSGAVTYAGTGGTIDSTGRYTAGSATGSFRVIARLDSTGPADTSLVTINQTAPTVQALVLTPASVSLEAGAKTKFTAAVKMSDGSTGSGPVTYTGTGDRSTNRATTRPGRRRQFQGDRRGRTGRARTLRP